MAFVRKSGSICCRVQLSGPLFELLAVRCMSTPAATEMKPVRVSRNLSFRPGPVSSKYKSEDRPLVLIYGWLGAKAQHIHKYGDFYLGKGYDVLHIKIEPLQLLWPRRAQAVISKIVDFISEQPRTNQPILIHGFSVGGYLYGETLLNIASDPAQLSTMKKRVRGQVFDSPVDFEGVPRGVGIALSDSPIVQKSIKFSLEAYLKLFHRQVTQYYIRSSQMFYNHPLRCPSFLFYSKADKVGLPETIEKVIYTWKSHGVQVQSKCWEETPHVEHFRHHPVQYITALNSFLSTIGLQSDSGATISQNNSDSTTNTREKITTAVRQK